MLSKSVVILLFLAVSLVACSSQVTSVGGGGTISLADTSASSPAADLASVEVEQVVIKVRASQILVHAGSSFFCYDPIDIRMDTSGGVAFEELAGSARQGLRAEGLSVAASNGEGATYLLRGRIGVVALTWCQMSFGVVNVEGRQAMYWELFSLLEQRVVYSTSIGTDIAMTENEQAESLITRALRLSVEQSARNLARDPGFRAALAKANAPAATASQDAAPIVLPRLPAMTGSFETNSANIQGATVLLKWKGHGSGFFISRDGYILTNAHVVEAADQITVELSTGEAVIGQVVRRNTVRDVALVKVPVDNVPALSMRLSLPAVGADVYAVGAPLDQYLSGTVTKGIVSSIRTDSDGTRYIQADVDIQAGNSGGPLTDGAGNTVGVAVLGIQTAGGGSIGLNFFIPIEDALAALDVVVR